MANSERQLFYTEGTWAKSPDHGRRSPDPLDDSTTCLYLSVHVQIVDSSCYIFDVKLHQYFFTCNTLTRKEPKGFTTKALVVFLHDWSWWHIPFIWWYIYLVQFVDLLEVILLPLLAIRRLDRAFQEKLKEVWLALVQEHLTTCTAPRLLWMNLHAVITYCSFAFGSLNTSYRDDRFNLWTFFMCRSFGL